MQWILRFSNNKQSMNEKRVDSSVFGTFNKGGFLFSFFKHERIFHFYSLWITIEVMELLVTAKREKTTDFFLTTKKKTKNHRFVLFLLNRRRALRRRCLFVRSGCVSALRFGSLVDQLVSRMASQSTTKER